MYRPLFRPQSPDPTTTLDWFNCTMTSGAMALDFHTLGKLKLWGGQLRRYSGDFSGGTSIGALQTAWTHYGYHLVDMRGHGWAPLITALQQGRGVVVQGDYDVLIGADSAQPSFNGDHAMYITPEFNGTKLLVGDPLAHGFKWIERAHIQRYMMKLGLRMYGSNDRLFYAVTAAHPVSGPTTKLVLWSGATKTVPFPDRQIVNVAAGRRANVRLGPSTAYKIADLRANGTVWTAYQKKVTKQGTWYGNQYGNRWVNAGNLKNIGGTS